MPRLTETRALRFPLPASGQTLKWCSEVRGFGVRLTPTTRSYIVQVRSGKLKPRITLGRVGVLPIEGPPDQPGARDLAVAAINAARRGDDPRIAIGRLAAKLVTLDDIWTSYENAGQPRLRGHGKKRASSCTNDRYRYVRLLRPSLGNEPADRLDTARVQRFLDTVKTEGERRAGLTLLKVILSYGRSRGLIEPARIDIATTPSRQVENYLTRAELARLDAALAEMGERAPETILSVAAIRMLIHTGARKNEILSLRWADLDLAAGLARLRITKSSDKGRDLLLSKQAVDVIETVPRTTTFVFPGVGKSGHLVSVADTWATALKRAGLRRVRLHDLRHSFAAAAVSQNISLHILGKLLGHARPEVTARYAHLQHDVAREALTRTADAIVPPPLTVAGT